MINRPADDSETWREKYLNALDAQEAQEREAGEQYQQLRRALVQVSIVADGQDQALDEVLDQLRRILRTETTPEQLTAVTDALNEQVHEFEHNREALDAAVLSALTTLVAQLQGMNPPRPLKKELQHYLARLPLRSEKFHLFPALLNQLAELQQQVFSELDSGKPGLMSRLRGEKAGATEASVSLQQEVNQVLQGLLGAVNSEYISPDTLSALTERTRQGVALQELPAFLEDVRDVILHSWLSANQIFANYLNSVNSELEAISGVLGGAVDHQVTRNEASESLRTRLAEQCDSLVGTVEEANDLKQLKTQVASQLGQIRDAVSQFQRSEKEAEPLTHQLAQLVSRVKTMEQEAEENRVSLRRHRHKAMHDPLTQLPNREAYEVRLAHEVKRWQRYGHPLTLAVCDVDHFKRINDQFGHQAGDRVLKVISKAIGRRLREVDFFGRYGGEEFVMLMPETGAKDALSVLNDVRAALADTAFHYQKAPLTITVSMGIAQFEKDELPEQVFARADRALYSAKAAGRNRCQIG